jgi:hypothetical protein
MKLFLGIFVLSFAVAYHFAENTNEDSIYSRLPSSAEDKKITKNSYEKIRCPREAEFQQWSKELSIDPMEGPSLDTGCDPQNFKNQLAKVLVLARELKFKFPKDFAPTVQAEIRNPYEYIRGKTNKLKVDLSQTSSVARNFVSQRQIELGRLFFNEEPLEALSTLVHEARHSDPNDQGHSFCRAGDILKTQGGCDNFFSKSSSDAGAYGYGVIFDMALAKHTANLDAAEKEMMLTNAFASLGTRFNFFKAAMAQHLDVVVVLLDDGTLGWIHPFSLELLPLDIELPEFKEKISRIEFNNRTNGLFLYTESGRFFEWGVRRKAVIPFSGALKKEDKVVEFSRQYVPFNHERTYFVSFKADGKLEYFKYNPDLNKTEILPYPINAFANRAPSKIPELKYFTAGHAMGSYFIDKRGNLTRAPHYGNEDDFIFDPTVQSSTGGWSRLTSGVFYEDLILTDLTGKIYQAQVEFVNGPDGDTEPTIRMVPFLFQSDSFAVKYQQGLSIHAVLDKYGALKIESYRVQQAPLVLSYSKKIIDFTVTRTTTLAQDLYSKPNLQDQAKQRCGIKKAINVTLGYSGVIGLTSDSRLVLAKNNNTCTELFKGKKFNTVSFIGADASAPDDSRPYPDLFLKLGNQNENLMWAPYTRSSLDQSK